MIRFLTVGAMILGLAIFGCGPSEESKSTSSPTNSATEKVAEAGKVAAEEVKNIAEPVVEKTDDIEKQAKPVVEKSTNETKEMADSTVDQAVVESKKIANEAEESTTLATDTDVEKKTVVAAAAAMATGKDVVAAQQAVIPEKIVLEASYGNITFPHATHASSYDCAICHGEGTPGLFGLDKKKAHGLCKDCHKQKGVGPTSCKECHKK
jgi:hypothetical protein